MTFEQFQATKTTSADIGLIMQEDEYRGLPGLVYLGVLYICTEHPSWFGTPAHGYKYHLMIENTEELSVELEPLERKLYDWATRAGYFEPRPAAGRA